MIKQDIVDCTVHSAQAVLEVHDSSRFWCGGGGCALDPSRSLKDGKMDMSIR